MICRQADRKASMFDNTINLQVQAEKIRRRVVEIIHSARSGHAGGSLSSIEIETALYFRIMDIDPKHPNDVNRDRFILSKGHSVEALYAVLAAVGFINDDMLETYGKCDSQLAGHPINKIPGIELNSGALGHGLGFGVGLAMAARMDRRSYKTFVLMGDGEQGEGSIYEAAMAAHHYKLDNLVAIIDRNGLQISGSTEEVMSLEPLRDRWEAFGWEVRETDGNSVDSLVTTFSSLHYGNDKPKLIIAYTTKGSGISFMERSAKWHHGVPSEAQFIEALAEIDYRIESLSEKKK